MNHDTLFLRGCPGATTDFERLWLGCQLPIQWWDHPREAELSAAPLDALAGAAQQELEAMAAACGKPVHVVAHSFGGQLAVQLARRCPERIRRITLMGCQHNFFRGIFRCIHAIAQASASHELMEIVAAAQRRLDRDSYEALAIAAASHPSFLAFYFGANLASDSRFVALLPQAQLLDLPTYVESLGKMIPQLLTPPAPQPGFQGEVVVVAGSRDPFLALEEDIAAWRGVFPGLRVSVVEAGHFLHLETAPSVWLEA